MYGDTEHFVSKTDIARSVVLPDGTQPAPLGSGSIAGLIGVGGMSNVYKIWNPQMEQYRAVKLMKPDLSPESRQRFQTEIKITAALSHPNIIEIHSVGEWKTLSYIEMEYIDGSTLTDIITKKGALPLPVCTAFGILIARALAYAHDKEYVLYGKTYRGLIHRDLKTSNIMIAKDGRVKLMDFGIARPVETSLMTLDGAVMGTMQYLAPEQIDGKNVGVTADIYSLGSILYETLTGRKAFPQKNLSQLMSAKTTNTFVPLRYFKTAIPRRLKNLAGRCMLSDPAKRPPSAGSLLNELEKIHDTLTSETPENTIVRFMQSSGNEERIIYPLRRRLPALVLAGGVLAGLVAGSIAGFLFMYASPPVDTLEVEAPKPEPRPVASSPEPAVKKVVPAPVQPAQKNAGAKSQSTVKRAASKTVSDSVPKTPKSLLDRLKESSGLTDPIEILINEANAGRYSSVLLLADELPKDFASDINVRLLRLRALVALNRTVEIARFLQQQSIDDGEFYLLKARFLLGKGDVGRAMQLIEKSVTVGARQRDAAMMRRDYLFYRAVGLGLLYEQSPDDTHKKEALDGWFEVKNSLRNYPDHAYFRKAVSEMQKIGSNAVRAGG